MKYPLLTSSKCAELATQRVEGLHPSVDAHTTWTGRGDEVDLHPLAAAADEIIGEAREWTDRDRDRFEGKVSTRLFTALARVPTEVLDNRGFWRFLSLRYFWEFIAWREAGPFSAGNYLKYVDASTSTESVLPRMYLRAQAVGGASHADLAAAIPQGGDFWRSHVIRVRTGSAPALTREFVKKQAEDRLATEPLRQVAKRLNRTWTNIVLYLYDDAEAASMIKEIWEQNGE